MPDYREVREQPCARCGGQIIYQYGNWYCGGYDASGLPREGCAWSTAQEAPAGRVTLEHCPSCGARIVYNGNYFCCGYFSGDCGWALPHPARKKADRDLAIRLTGSTR